MMNTRRLLPAMALLLVAGLGLSSCAGRADQASTQRVAIDGTQFTPRDITVPLGGTVTWTNGDPFPHNVTADTMTARSGDLAPGAAWSFRAEQRGTFTYRCTLHPGMTGVLHVR